MNRQRIFVLALIALCVVVGVAATSTQEPDRAPLRAHDQDRAVAQVTDTETFDECIDRIEDELLANAEGIVGLPEIAGLTNAELEAVLTDYYLIECG